jgi:hypothetical protein
MYGKYGFLSSYGIMGYFTFFFLHYVGLQFRILGMFLNRFDRYPNRHVGNVAPSRTEDLANLALSSYMLF